MPIGLEEHLNTLRSMTEAFTPEEIEKYATYHWRMVGTPVKTKEMSDTDGPEFDNSRIVCHVWRTIGGMTEYLGTHQELEAKETPAEQLPLIPVLDFSAVDGGGPMSAAGGVIPWQKDPEGT